MEFMTYEDLFSEKMVNLQNTYCFIPFNMKSQVSNSNQSDILSNYIKNKEVYKICLYA